MAEAIPWDAFDASDLDDASREAVGRAWRHRSRMEHLAVGAFAELTLELVTVGAPDVILELVTRAASDEVRHAAQCRRMAQLLLGASEVPSGHRGRATLPTEPGVSPRVQALLHVVEMGCLNETFTGVYFTEMLACATTPLARALVKALLEDEIHHGRLGWAYLAVAAGQGWGLSEVSAALPQLVERAVASVLEDEGGGESAVDVERARGHGWLSASEGARIYRDALHTVILPGFTEAGLDVSQARARAEQRGWLPGDAARLPSPGGGATTSR